MEATRGDYGGNRRVQPEEGTMEAAGHRGETTHWRQEDTEGRPAKVTCRHAGAVHHPPLHHGLHPTKNKPWPVEPKRSNTACSPPTNAKH